MILAIFIISIVFSITGIAMHLKKKKSSYGGFAAINVLSSWFLWSTGGVVSLCIHGALFLILVSYTAVNKNK